MNKQKLQALDMKKTISQTIDMNREAIILMEELQKTAIDDYQRIYYLCKHYSNMYEKMLRKDKQKKKTIRKRVSVSKAIELITDYEKEKRKNK